MKNRKLKISNIRNSDLRAKNSFVEVLTPIGSHVNENEKYREKLDFFQIFQKTAGRLANGQATNEI